MVYFSSRPTASAASTRQSYQGASYLTNVQIILIGNTCRVHLTLNFKKFDAASRWKIWKTYFDRLSTERKDIGVHYRVLQYAQAELAKQDWNGREIRNGEFRGRNLTVLLIVIPSFPDSRHLSHLQRAQEGKAIERGYRLGRIANHA